MRVAVEHIDLLRQCVLSILRVVHDAAEGFHAEVGVLKRYARPRYYLVNPLDIDVNRLVNIINAHFPVLGFSSRK